MNARRLLAVVLVLAVLLSCAGGIAEIFERANEEVARQRIPDPLPPKELPATVINRPAP